MGTTMHHRTKYYITIFVFSAFIPQLLAQIADNHGHQRNVQDSLTFLFNSQLSILPHEKIYLHTDKPYYISGEKIWFRAHYVDAIFHIPITASRYIYIELINPLDSIVNRVKIRPDENEAYYGYMPIPKDLPEGDYTLRAYTTYMRNIEENYFFTKALHIGNPLEEAASNYPRVFLEPDNDFDLSFYPEGGALLLGTITKVAFKAMKSNGASTAVTGVIYNTNGTEVCTFNSEWLGMGSFAFLAQKGEHYFALCEDEKGISKTFELPAAIEQGYALSVNLLKDMIYISVLQPAGVNNHSPLYLMAHTRGMIHFVDQWDHEKNMIILPLDGFPSGVLHLILFDHHLNPVSERLVFIHNNDQAQVTYQTDRESYTPRTLVKNYITLTDPNGAPLSGTFSVSVTSDREVLPDTTTNILTQLLLTSDLHGHIEHPSSYFQNTPESNHALDLLMMTQGWRRYHAAEWAQGHFTTPLFPLEPVSGISGIVQGLSTGKPQDEVEVNVIALSYGYYDVTQTNQEGRFFLPINEWPDSTRFLVSVKPSRGLINMDLILDKETFPDRTLSAFPPAGIEQSHFSLYTNKVLQFVDESGIHVTTLDAAVVTAQQKQHIKSAFYSFSDDMITEEQLDLFPPFDMASLLQRFPGLQVIRGSDLSIIGVRLGGRQEGVPVLLIDDMPMNFETINYILPNDIVQIDLLRGSRLVAFLGGVLSAPGIIAIHTKRTNNIKLSDFPLFHIKTISPLGYQQPVEFYAPKYETELERKSATPDLRTTIHWQPVVQIDTDGFASFEFYTADDPASYTVIIEGIADDGTIIWKESKIGEKKR